MTLVDANLLIYSYIQEGPHHGAAKDWLEESFRGTAAVGVPWASLLAFVRISANARIFERPASILGAWAQVEEWLDLDNVWVPEPTELHQEVLGSLLQQVGSNINLVPDAHLAALAIEHDLTLYSADRDFARFSDLRWENPLDENNQ